GARLPHVRRPDARARPLPRGARCGRDRERVLLRRSAPPPAGAALPWLEGGLAAGDREGVGREPGAADVGGDPCGDAGAGGQGDSRGRRGARLNLITRHRIWQLAADACLVALAWYLAFTLRFDTPTPVYYETLLKRSILVVVAINLAVFIALGFYNRW